MSAGSWWLMYLLSGPSCCAEEPALAVSARPHTCAPLTNISCAHFKSLPPNQPSPAPRPLVQKQKLLLLARDGGPPPQRGAAVMAAAFNISPNATTSATLGSRSTSARQRRHRASPFTGHRGPARHSWSKWERMELDLHPVCDSA